MSYIVSIERSGAAPITPSEVALLCQADPSLSLVDADTATARLCWRSDDDASSFCLVFFEGALDSVGTPSDEALVKMQTIAAALNARVIGEEGEDLTQVPIKPMPKGCAPVVILLLAAGAAVFFLF